MFFRPLHEACENSHVEMMRLLLAYGADPLLGTYAGQTPEELTEGQAARFLQLHIADAQGKAIEPWKFRSPAELLGEFCSSFYLKYMVGYLSKDF